MDRKPGRWVRAECVAACPFLRLVSGTLGLRLCPQRMCCTVPCLVVSAVDEYLQVVTYEGLCEQFKYQKAENPTASPLERVRDPRLKPWLKANPTTMATPQERFKQQFFVANRTGG